MDATLAQILSHMYQLQVEADRLTAENERLRKYVADHAGDPPNSKPEAMG